MMDKYFRYREHKTNFRTEIRGGTATFLTMAYILALNPMILSAGGFGPEKGFGFWRCLHGYDYRNGNSLFYHGFLGKNVACGLASGMGLNGFVAFGVVAGMGYSPQQALVLF